MCGIAGIICGRDRAVTPEEILTLGETLAHRGPDGQGAVMMLPDGRTVYGCVVPSVRDAQVALVHRRLSIIDLSDGGAQPMASPDGRYWMVYNGEIYNYLELKDQLRSEGVQFRSSSDSEVLLAAFCHWGPACLERLNGMFAVAILDVRHRTVWLARDRFGIKPLYVSTTDGRLAFASELPSLLRVTHSRPILRVDRVFTYLRAGQTDEGDATLLDNIYHLPAAHWAEVSVDEPGLLHPVRYWSPSPRPSRDISFKDAVSETRERFLASVALHLRSDVPVGVCLSGGIDSSAVLSAVRHLVGPHREVHAFSFLADSPEDNEEPWIRIVAAATGATLHTIMPPESSRLAELEALMNVQGEPFGSTSIYAQWHVFQEVKAAGVKVVLDGQGADEFLAGYASYIGAYLASQARRGRVVDALRMYRQMPRAHSAGRVSHLLFAQYLIPPFAQRPLRRLVRKEVVPRWINAKWLKSRGVALRPHHVVEAGDMMRAEMRHSITGNLRSLLRYEDRNSMHASVESRVPFLTGELYDHFASLPDEYLIRSDGLSKYVFREAMRGIVPEAILNRRDKIGFRSPEAKWLRAARSWVEDALFGDAGRRLPFLNQSGLAAEWQRVLADPRAYNSWIWRCVNLIKWADRLGAVPPD